MYDAKFPATKQVLQQHYTYQERIKIGTVFYECTSSTRVQRGVESTTRRYSSITRIGYKTARIHHSSRARVKRGVTIVTRVDHV